MFSDNNNFKLEVNHRKQFWNPSNTWTLENSLLKNEWVYQEIKEEIKKKTHGSEWKWKHDSPKLWDAAKAVPGGKYIAIKAYIKKQGRSQVHNLNLHLQEPKKGTANKA